MTFHFHYQKPVSEPSPWFPRPINTPQSHFTTRVFKPHHPLPLSLILRLITETTSRLNLQNYSVMEHIPTPTTIKFLYSYGGKILPRATDGELRYSGGHTRVLTIDPSMSFSELMVKLNDLCGSSSVTLKCLLPNGNLETLISITSDEDLANIVEEYDRVSLLLTHPLKIRAILSPLKKLSSSLSSSSSATHSSSGSPHSSAESPPYAVARQFFKPELPPVLYPVGGGYGSVKDSWYPGQFGSPRFLYRGPHSYNYCH
ncbi:hypothetical protein Lal_00049501 [Lupinus albus]|nr:hypothetical protein Lal_00049501 [Lupinus albus]